MAIMQFQVKRDTNNNPVNDKLAIGSNKFVETTLKNSTVHVLKYHPYKKSFVTAVGSERHDKAYKELCSQSITHITSESILCKGSPTQVKSYFFNKAQPCLNCYLNISTPSIQHQH